MHRPKTGTVARIAGSLWFLFAAVLFMGCNQLGYLNKGL